MEELRKKQVETLCGLVEKKLTEKTKTQIEEETNLFKGAINKIINKINYLTEETLVKLYPLFDTFYKNEKCFLNDFLGINQSELGRKLKVSRQAIYLVMKGERSISKNNLKELFSLLKINKSLDDFLN